MAPGWVPVCSDFWLRASWVSSVYWSLLVTTVVLSISGVVRFIGPKYILFGYMDP